MRSTRVGLESQSDMQQTLKVEVELQLANCLWHLQVMQFQLVIGQGEAWEAKNQAPQKRDGPKRGGLWPSIQWLIMTG